MPDRGARTTDISSSGCFVVAPQPILVGQRIRLTNLVNSKESDAHVVRHGQQSGSNWNWAFNSKANSMTFGVWSSEARSWFDGLPEEPLAGSLLHMEILIVIADIAIMAVVAGMLDSIASRTR
jgi:hypothetical protein